MLEINEIKNSVLVGGVREHEIMFTDLDELKIAIDSVNQYLTANKYEKLNYQLSHDAGNKFIEEWKNEHSQKVQEVIQKKEAEQKAKLERVAAAKKILPKLKESFKEFESIISEIQGIDKDTLKGNYFYGSFNNKSFDEVFKEFKECIENTLKAK